MEEKLSFYMIVKNSERYLNDILSKISFIADEIILVDSGSQDQTRLIAERWQAQWFFRPFDHFRNQRSYALSLCRHRYVLFLDDDEIPDDSCLHHIQNLKKTGFSADAYKIPRKWIVLGKAVSCIYPILSPDFPIRLVNKEKMSFQNSNRVHEDYSGSSNIEILAGFVSHFTFHNQAELQRKLNFYSTIAAQDLADKKAKCNLAQLIFNPLAAWFKWYLIRRGWRDGRTGLILANYAMKYTFQKYAKFREHIAKRI